MDVLTHVRELREVSFEKRFFHGYSGNAKVFGGSLALFTSCLLATELVPRTVNARLISWLLLGLAGMIVNYAALFHWYGAMKGERRRPELLAPAIDAFPSIFVGAVLTYALISAGAYDLLFGTWMTLYGIAHMSYRILLPKTNYAVGAFYMVCGTFFLLHPPSFLNPWPMGIVFFCGELVGGVVLERNSRRKA